MLKLLLNCIFVFILGVFVANFIYIPSAHAQTCTTPAQVPNVEVTYPSCVGDQCNFTQASCSWGQVTGAANYQVTATEVESGSIVFNQSVVSTTTSVTFNITQNKTYKCDVAAKNSCGTSGPIGTHSLLCAADAAVTTNPTSPPVVANPTIPAVGSTLYTITAGFAVIFLVAGLLIFLI